MKALLSEASLVLNGFTGLLIGKCFSQLLDNPAGFVFVSASVRIAELVAQVYYVIILHV
jgi:hypothetical protein